MDNEIIKKIGYERQISCTILECWWKDTFYDYVELFLYYFII